VQVFDSSTLQELPFSKEELNELGRMNTPTLGYLCTVPILISWQSRDVKSFE
jgi:hypothetical protein